MCDYDEEENIVIDMGSGITKIGWAGDDAPKGMFPSVMISPQQHQHQQESEKSSTSSCSSSSCYYFGHEAISKSEEDENNNFNILNSPIQNGIVNNWNQLERLYNYSFHEKLKADPSNRTVLVTEPPLTSKHQQERMISMMFESFNVGGYFSSITAMLTLYASGRNGGVVVESGDSTFVVPVFESKIVPHAVHRMDVAGNDLTNFLLKLLKRQEEENENESLINNNSASFSETKTAKERMYFHNIPSAKQQRFARQIKEKNCYVALDFDDEMKKINSNKEETDDEETDFQYYLPDSEFIVVNKNRNKKELLFTVPETMFNSRFIQNVASEDSDTLPELVLKSISKCPLDIRRQLSNSIVLGGGNSLLTGFDDRLQKDIQNLSSSPNAKFRIAGRSPERLVSAWIGASILASLSTFQGMYITKAEYEENGPGIIHTKGAG